MISTAGGLALCMIEVTISSKTLEAPIRNNEGFSHSSPSSHLTNESHSIASLEVLIPPAGLNPI